MRLRYLNLSAALIALICFFMPWVQVSCGGVKDTMSGLDLARDGHPSLWFVPLFMGGVVLLGIVRAWRRSSRLFAVASAACGLISTYLMNRERLRSEQTSDLIVTQLTGWFWLGMLASLFVGISALALLFKKARAQAVENLKPKTQDPSLWKRK
jgi:hypothetical protein